MKIIIFGTGLYYEKSKNNHDIPQNDIIAFLDNDRKKTGKFLDGREIFHPDQLSQLAYDRIVIMSSYYPQIREQLLQLHVEESKIYYYPLGGYEYNEWFQKHKAAPETLLEQRTYTFLYRPLISIIVPTFNTPETFLREMIESVQNQTYSNWELCIADGSDQPQTRTILNEYAALDGRIQIIFLDENLGISANTNRAVEMSHGDYLAFLDHDDLLEPDALFEVAKVLEQPAPPDFIYTDEDKMEASGKYVFWPLFKPDYSPDLLISYAYILHLMVVSRKLMDKTGKFDSRFDGAQDHDMSLRLTENAEKIAHIPKVLYHWRSHPESLAGNIDSKQYGIEADERCVSEFLQRQIPRGYISARIGMGASFQVGYELLEKPLVSIIVSVDEYDEAVKMLWKKNMELLTYENFELFIACKKQPADDCDGIHIVKCSSSLTTVQCKKQAVKNSHGKYLLFLEHDSIIKSPDYIEQLLMQCQRDSVGIAGGKILDLEGNVQSAGLILGDEVPECYVHIKQDSLYFGRNEVARNLSAVSRNGMMVERGLLEDVGGISGEYQEGYWDIDLCLKFNKKKKRIIFNPLAKIITRRNTKFLLQKDKKIFKKRWKHILKSTDCYYSKFLSMYQFNNKNINVLSKNN